jgi:DNA-binding SARP family transcriptional activator
LAILTVNANRVVSANRLIDDLWEQDPPRSAAATLQTYVYQLRRALPFPAVATRSDGYALEVSPRAIDAVRFETVATGIATRHVRGDAARAATELTSALALWRGRALEGFEHAIWAEPEIARLEDLRLAALERSHSARLELGEHVELIGNLEMLVRRHPFRELLTGQLMLALYRAGRQADALRAYSRLRHRLRDELGIEPGRDVARLEEAILLQKPELEWSPDETDSGCNALGDHALAEHIPDAAAAAFTRSLALIDAQVRPYEVRRTEALVGLGTAQHQQGDPAAAQTLLDAASAAQRIGEPDLVIRAFLANNRRSAHKAGAVDRERVRLLEASVASDAEGAERASLLALLAAELEWTDRGRARRVSDEALVLARHAGDDRRLWEVLATRQQIIWAPSTLVERRANAQEQLDAADRVGDPSLRWSAIANLANAAVCAGDIGEADRLHALVLGHVTSTGLAPHRALAAQYEAWRALLAGDVDEAENAAAEAFALWSATGEPNAKLTYAAQMFEIRRAQGRLASVIDGRTHPDVSTRPVNVAHLAVALCQAGRLDDAEAVFRPLAQDRFAALPFDSTWLAAASASAETAAALDDLSAASILADRLVPWRDQFVFTGVVCRGSVERPLALALTTAGRLDDAEDAFVRATRRHEEVAAPIELARTELDCARMLQKRARAGDIARAHVLLENAATTARRLGLASIQRDAETLLRIERPA